MKYRDVLYGELESPDIVAQIVLESNRGLCQDDMRRVSSLTYPFLTGLFLCKNACLKPYFQL